MRSTGSAGKASAEYLRGIALPVADFAPAMDSPTRAVWRAAGLFCHMIFCILRYLWAAARHGFSPALGATHAHRFARSVNRLLGIQVHMRGPAPRKGTLIVANHRSYIDATAVLDQTMAGFLAKSEVESWPVIGLGTRLGGTIFVQRDNAESRKAARRLIAERLRQGLSVVVFPEGTTHRGPDVLPFKKGVFHIAAEGRIPVTPLAITCEQPTDAWIGAESFLGHFLRVFVRKRVHINVHCGPVFVDSDPDALRNAAWEWITQACLCDEQ